MVTGLLDKKIQQRFCFFMVFMCLYNMLALKVRELDFIKIFKHYAGLSGWNQLQPLAMPADVQAPDCDYSCVR